MHLKTLRGHSNIEGTLTWKLGHSEGTQRALGGDSESTRRVVSYLGTWRAIEQSEGTWELRGHSGTWKALGHSST